VTTTTRPHPSTARILIRHYLEMVAAMVIGMIVLAPLWTLGLRAAGTPDLLDRPELGALVMATNMTIAMAAWMRYRGHRWTATAEMAAAMYLPFLVLFIPLWLGLISTTGLVVLGHVLMLAGMAALMILRSVDYTDHSAKNGAGHGP
jgi:hypothetical protein